MNYTIVATIVIVVIAVAMFLMKRKAPNGEGGAVGSSRKEREQTVEQELAKLNAFKNSARVNMKPSKFKYEITMRVRKLERELGVKVVASSIMSEGDIVLDYA